MVAKRKKVPAKRKVATRQKTPAKRKKVAAKKKKAPANRKKVAGPTTAYDRSGSSANSFGLPNLDFNELLGRFHLPGVDMEQLVEHGRKNIEAVQQANQAVIDGWQTIAEKQAEMFRETMEGLQKAMTERLSGSAAESGERQAELAREGFDKALENVRQLAEIAADSQSKAFEIIRERFEANMQAMVNQGARSDD